MVCEACRYVNKDTAVVCRHCGAALREQPQTMDLEIKAEPRAVQATGLKAAPRAARIDLPPRRTSGFSGSASPSQKSYSFSGNNQPKAVKTISFAKPQDDKAAAAKREYDIDAEEQDEFEEDAGRSTRRDNIKFIAIVASLIVFVVGAIIVFSMLLLNNPGTSPASNVTAPPSTAATASTETLPASAPAAAESPDGVN